MRAMLIQGRLEIRQQLLREVCRVTPALQPFDELQLARHMPLALSDVMIHHLQIGRCEGHSST